MKKEWILDSNNSNEKSLIKRLLLSRGIKTDEEMKEFLNPFEMTLTSPNVFTDMEKTVQRLSKAIENKEVIIIYGDFDADGVTSTSILYKTLKYLNADVHYFIPDRENEGHGFDKKALIKLMTTVKPKVIISVDCGISDVDAVKFINSFKIIDVIITDHHEAPEILPEAYAIINPKAPNALDASLSAKQIEHLTYLAGCGVAFKVAQALLTKYSKTEFIYEVLPFVAVGTVADVVPLLGENRYFVSKGLELISQGKHYGLKRLLESAGYNVNAGVTSEQIAFGIAPRINASGRLDTVDAALKVLISENPQEIEMAVTTLNELNKVRQTLCDEIFAQADKMVQKEGNKNPAIVLYSDAWHIGIIGIVASKLVEKYYKPVFLMSYVKEKDQFRCSARSIEGVPLYDVIASNSELFDGFGGHKLAAGLSFTGSNTPFEVVKKALNDTVREYIAGKELKPFVNIDLILEPKDITIDLVEDLSKLEPFGASNPSPVFVLNNLRVSQKRLMGSDNSHLRLIVSSDTDEFTSIWWKHGDIGLSSGDIVDIAFHPQINEYNGNISVQLIIDDIHSDSLVYDDEIVKSKFKIYDNRNKTGILANVNDYIKNSKYNIRIFAESRYILDTIKPYSEISSKTFTRQDIPQCDIIMFFDYPADRQTLDLILEKTQAKGLHFMAYEPKILDEQELLKTFTGMLKFACHNNGGKVELVRCASFLGKSVKIFEMLLDLYEECGFIKILEKNSSFYKIEFNGVDDISKILHSEKYSQIFDLILECEDFQKTLLEEDLEQILV
ncbi:single-stranded-DNA-specific exonuclease RecJ [bacterium]|nr:single-stranded-DNA-specific exonuclease RecJ [bacterium]